MSRLYGVNSHAAICKRLKKYKKCPFCDCCVYTKKNTTRRTVKMAAELTQDFDRKMVQFLQKHHLSVFIIEKKIAIQGLNGRVDCVFIENIHKKTLYIVDWKFTRYVPHDVYIQHRIQLSLYAYIMKRMDAFSTYNFKTFCFFFAPGNKIKILHCEILGDDFLESLISRMC